MEEEIVSQGLQDQGEYHRQRRGSSTFLWCGWNLNGMEGMGKRRGWKIRPGQDGESPVSLAREGELALKGKRSLKGFPAGQWQVGCCLLETVLDWGTTAFACLKL